MSMPTNTRFLVRSSLNSALIYCTDDEFHHETQCGPGGFCAKLYKTVKGASAVRDGSVSIHKCDRFGVEETLIEHVTELTDAGTYYGWKCKTCTAESRHVLPYRLTVKNARAHENKANKTERAKDQEIVNA